MSAEAAAKCGTSKNLSAIIHRKRKKEAHVPPAPTHRSEFDIPEEFTKTTTGDPFLIFDSGREDNSRILVFGSPVLLNVISEYPHWFVDGTFKVSPTVFYQLFTIHALVQDSVVPCIFALLPDKSHETYVRLWRGIIDNVDQTLDPQSVLSDFELASVQAIRDTFPNAAVKGCFFHLGQSLWRHVQQYNLANLYKENEGIRVKIKSLLSLAFLPEDGVADAFDILTETYPVSLHPLTNYFEDIYIGRAGRRNRRAPSFPISMWSMEDRVHGGLPRTNNSVEAWHLAFQSTVQCAHPTIWTIIQAIIKENGLQEYVLAQTVAGNRPLQKKTKYARINKSILTLIEQRETIPMLDFLRGVSYNLEMNL